MSSSHFNILSSWSKAGVGTSIVLELKRPPSPSSSKTPPNTRTKPSARIAFDMGATPCFDDAIPAKYVFVSHGHVDHVGALFAHARAHAVTMGGAAPTYFVPEPLLPQIEKCRDAMTNLDASNLCPGGEGGRRDSLIKMKLVGVHPGDEVPLKGINYGSRTSFFVRALQVDHAGHPALGYVIGNRTVLGLKKEYRNLNGAQIRELVKSGVSIKDDPIEKIEVAYTGDTCANGLLGGGTCEWEQIMGEERTSLTANQKPSFDIGQMFQAELFLCELTYLDSSEGEEQRMKAEERGHMHINDLESIFLSRQKYRGNKDQFSEKIDDGETALDVKGSCQRPNDIVFYHLSAKYGPAEQALNLIVEGLPDQLRDCCHVAISSMLTNEEKHRGKKSFLNLMKTNGCIHLAEYISSLKNTQECSGNEKS